MEREIVLDTETTGVDPKTDKIIEVAAIEVEGTRETGRVFHRFYNPNREIDPGATRVHGMTWDDLRDKPLFQDGAAELARFLDGRTLVIHNATFDIGMLDAEFARTRHRPRYGTIVDTLPLARRRHPGAASNLDALCDRYGIDRSGRTKHGGLVDVKLLFQVYIRLVGRDQLIPLDAAEEALVAAAAGDLMPAAARQAWFPDRRESGIGQPDADELARHEAFLALVAEKSKGRLLWGARDKAD